MLTLRNSFYKKNLFTTTDNNIFKQDIIDPECCLLNKCLGTINSFYEKNWDNNNIVKYYKDKDNFATEIILHYYLSNKRITTDFDINLKNKKLSYILDGKISLYNYLETCNHYGILRVLSNELFAFVNNFKKHDFVHGNLHIGNIFINPQKLTLCIIDFTHAYLVPNKSAIDNKDLDSLYKLLHKYFTQKGDRKSLLYLDKLFKPFKKG
jgi:hypothetical protein